MPRVTGAFVLAVQVEDSVGTPLTAYRSQKGFRVSSHGSQLALVAAPYTSTSRTERQALAAGL